MRAELSPAPEGTAVPVPEQPAPGRGRGDLVAIAVLIALPALVFGVPALLGHPVYPGDDLTQNLPLRELAGQQSSRYDDWRRRPPRCTVFPRRQRR